MHYRLLGQLEVIGDSGEALALSGPERVLLATLVLSANRTVSTERLIDALWGHDPPETAHNDSQVHVSKLRKMLASAGAPEALVSAQGGYVLRTEAGEVDVARFEDLVQRPSGEPVEVAERLREALTLWRGPALCDIASEVLGSERARLEELRMLALERRIEAELALGHHAEVIAELEALVRTDPLREGPRRQLMVALYRAGRSVDALSTYREARDVLAEELGVDPGPKLQALELAILRQDPALEAPSVPEVVEPWRTGPPTGTVTLLMSDIEGSTRLWEEHPAEMALALRRHDLLLRQTIEAHAGYVFKTVGDAFCAAFPTAAQALAAASEVQQLLGREQWPAPVGLRVRMAIHSGECEERDGDYFGPTVNRVARLEAIAHGGQVVVSGTSIELLDAPEQAMSFAIWVSID